MLSEKISNNEIDNLYNYCINWCCWRKNSGAGAGFFTLYIAPENKED